MHFNPPTHIQGASDAPFTVVNRRTKPEVNGDFVPGAEVSFSKGSAASGVFKHLSAVELQTLMAVLSLVDANGRVRPTCYQVSVVLGQLPLVTYARLKHLTRKVWRGKPVLVRVGSWGDIVVYVPSSELIAHRLGPKETAEEPSNGIAGAGRDKVIEWSRSQYARKREDVERQLVEDNGWEFWEEGSVSKDYMKEVEPHLSGDDRHARQRLMRLGVDIKTADSLVRKFGRDKIAMQVAYLPYRRFKEVDKVKVLIASIEGNYPMPPELKSTD
jgi:hypothetical protein